MSMGEFERGLKEGRIDALLEEHTGHLAKINGSIERFAIAVEELAGSNRELASEIRTLQEEGRIAAERVKVAADTLEVETERRRKELADTALTTEKTESAGDRKFSKRERIAALAVSIGIALLALYAARHGISTGK